jgi:hypothetical protein
VAAILIFPAYFNIQPVSPQCPGLRLSASPFAKRRFCEKGSVPLKKSSRLPAAL